MADQHPNLNPEVTRFLDSLGHPFRTEIEELRQVILSAGSGLTENIKWNGPNYSFHNNDRITMKIHPPRLIQLVFHRGAKAQEQPAEKLIIDNSGLLVWKENDRAIATFRNMADIENTKTNLVNAIKAWLTATNPTPMNQHPFPEDFYEHLKAHTLTDIKGGSRRTTFLDIWMVNVDGRIFARSWGKSERSWFTAFLEEGTGQIKYGEKVIDVKGRPCTDPETNAKIDQAYRERYTNPESLIYVEGITRPEYRDYTMEFIYSGE